MATSLIWLKTSILWCGVLTKSIFVYFLGNRKRTSCSVVWMLVFRSSVRWVDNILQVWPSWFPGHKRTKVTSHGRRSLYVGWNDRWNKCPTAHFSKGVCSCWEALVKWEFDFNNWCCSTAWRTCMQNEKKRNSSSATHWTWILSSYMILSVFNKNAVSYLL